MLSICPKCDKKNRENGWTKKELKCIKFSVYDKIGTKIELYGMECTNTLIPIVRQLNANLLSTNNTQVHRTL